jgi:ADP-heptose:LPS heptosyltransferase
VHPGASDAARRWSPEHFAVTADYFARDGYRVVLTGSAGEASVTADVARRMRYGALDLAGCTSLGAMAALLGDAAIVVSNDTGVSHLAAALRAPSVIVFLASDPLRWAPLDRTRHRVVGRDGLLPEQVAPDAVLREAYSLIGRGLKRAPKAEKSAKAPRAASPASQEEAARA